MIIIDNNKVGCCTSGAPDVLPILHALKSKKATMVYGGSKLLSEYSGNQKFMTLLAEFKRLGTAKLHSSEAVDAEQLIVERLPLTSDDPHIIALARVSGARLLISEDSALRNDFKNRTLIASPRGKVYNSRSANRLISLHGL